MTQRFCAALLLALVLCPAPAAAQLREPHVKPRISVTPTFSYRFPYTAQVEGSLFTDRERVDAEFRERRGGGTVVGGEAEMRLFGPIGLIAGAGYAEPAANWVSQDGGRDERYIGPRVWMYTAGLLIRLPEPEPDLRRFPIVTSITLAPGIVREEPRPDPLPDNHPLFVPSPWGRIDHPALNLGVKASVKLGSRHVAFQFGASDWITFWNTAEMERQLQQAYRQPPFYLDVIADYEMKPSHLFQLNAGFSIRY